jgi:hypothetical protein
MPLPFATPGVPLRGLIAAVAVLACAGLASASCGDYVHIAPKGEPAEPPAPNPPPCWCEHGHCHAPLPLPVGEPTTVESQPPTDALLLADAFANPSRSLRRPADSDHGPSRTSSGVFHPPRG